MCSCELLTSVLYPTYFFELQDHVVYNRSYPLYLMFKDHTYLVPIHVTSEDLKKEAKVLVLK